MPQSKVAAAAQRKRRQASGLKCKHHPGELATCVATVGGIEEASCARCREKGEANWLHQVVPVHVAAKQLDSALAAKVAQLQKVRVGVSQVVQHMQAKLARLRQESVGMCSDVSSKLERVERDMRIRKEELMMEVKAVEKCRARQLQIGISALRKWDQGFAGTMPVEVDAFCSLFHRTDDLSKMARYIVEQAGETKKRLDRAINLQGELGDALPLRVTNAEKVQFEYTGEANTEFDLVLSVAELECVVGKLDFTTKQEYSDLLLETQCLGGEGETTPLVGKLTPKDRRAMEETGNTMKALVRERNSLQERVDVLMMEKEQALAELAALSTHKRARGDEGSPNFTALAQAMAEIESLKNELARARGVSKDTRAAGQLHDELAAENQRLRASSSGQAKEIEALRSKLATTQQMQATERALCNADISEIEKKYAATKEQLEQTKAELENSRVELSMEQEHGHQRLLEMSQEWRLRQQEEVECARLAANRVEAKARDSEARANELLVRSSEQAETIAGLKEEVANTRTQLKRLQDKFFQMLS